MISKRKIMIVVAHVFDYPIKLLLSENRERQISEARTAYYYLAKKLTKATLQEIAGFANRKDHTTILYGLETAQDLIDTNSKYALKIKRCKELLGINYEN
jgi:chromosomal replication initiator protein